MRVNSTNETQYKDFRLAFSLGERGEGRLSVVPDKSPESPCSTTLLALAFGHLTHPTNERRLNQYFRLCQRSASHYGHLTGTLIGCHLEARSLIGQGGIRLPSGKLELGQRSPAARQPWRPTLMSTTASP